MDHSSNSAETSNALTRALNVLEEVSRAGEGVSFTTLRERCEMPKATLSRITNTLLERRYLDRDARTGEFTAGSRCFELGSMWAQNLDVRAVASPTLAWLNSESRETVHLGVYEYGDVIYIDRLESPQQVIAKSYVGRRCVATCVATGRVLLAYSDHAEIDRVLSQPLPRFTDHSITDPTRLRSLLEQTRQDGYAINRCSYRPDVSGIAAPIRDHTGKVIASVGLCLPDHRFTDDRFDELLDLTQHASTQITRSLGGPASVLTPASNQPTTVRTR